MDKNDSQLIADEFSGFKNMKAIGAWSGLDSDEYGQKLVDTSEAFTAGWYARKEREDRSGPNYTADDDTFPTEVYFANGRKVGIAFDGDKPYLTIGWVANETKTKAA